MYKKWKKGTTLTLVMRSKAYKVHVLVRKKTCRIGVGWNEFILKNKLKEGQTLHFSLSSNNTFQVTKTGYP